MNDQELNVPQNIEQYRDVIIDFACLKPKLIITL